LFEKLEILWLPQNPIALLQAIVMDEVGGEPEVQTRALLPNLDILVHAGKYSIITFD
jgi:hypothetical protein